MKGVVCVGPSKLEMHYDIPIEEPQADEVLIRLIACGLCHTGTIVSVGQIENKQQKQKNLMYI